MLPATRRLLASLAALGASLAGVDATLAHYAQAHFGPNRILNQAIAAGDGCVVVIGDSRMQAGIDAGSLRSALGAGSCVASLGIGALGIEGQGLALRRYVSAPREPVAVVLGAGPILPMEPVDPSKMVGNMAVELAWSRAQDVGAFFPGFPLRSLDPGLRFSIERTNAIETYASLVWEKMQPWQARLAGSSVGASNRFGLVEDMRRLVDGFAVDALERLERWSDAWSEGPWFDAIDATARATGAALVVVHVPMPAVYRRRVNDTPLWRAYQAWLSADLRKRGDRYIDMSASIDDSLFEDGVHLDAEGARLFSRQLGKAMTAYVVGAHRR